MRKRNLSEWLDYQLTVHKAGIDMGLARAGEVWRRMGAPRVASRVVTVGGTNGKGSTVAFLEAMLAAAGRRAGAYVSPHVLRYNERVRIAGREADDALLIDAFERIEAARGEIPLTYFEFGTLAALWIFSQSKLDVALLEVGLGGRLDAVNIVDADAAIVTTIALDHEDWLGSDPDGIAREKAGIFRAARPAVIGDAHAPSGLLRAALDIGALPIAADRDYRIADAPGGWSLQFPDECYALPEPALAAPVQRANAAAAIAALRALRPSPDVPAAAFAQGVRTAHAPVRLQRLTARGLPDLIVDVAHNPQAAAVLARWLAARPCAAGRDLAVFGALSDKDVAGITAPLAPHVVHWFVGGLDAATPRGLASADLIARMDAAAAPRTPLATLADALDAAAHRARAGERILAFGSFFVAAAALEWAAARGYR